MWLQLKNCMYVQKLKNKMYQTGNPLGSWSDLKPNLGKQIFAIIKARFFMKFRDKATMIEILASFVIIIFVAPAFYFTGNKYPLEKTPQIKEITNQSIFDWFSAFGKNTIVVCIPDKPLMHYLIGNTTILKYAIEGGTIPNTTTTFSGTRHFFFNSEKELKSEFFKSNNNAVGFQWLNIDAGEEALLNPHIKISIQSIIGNPNVDFFIELRNSIIKMIYLTKNEDEKIDTSLSLTTTLYKSKFAHPSIERKSNVYSFAYGIVASLVCVVASISDMEFLFVEKQNRLLAFSFLMGMKETAFWIANFICSFVVCLISYLVVSLVLAFWFGLNKNDFTMIFVFSVIFIVAELWFQFFLSTFASTTSNGRWITISLIMIGIATGFLFQFTAFQKESEDSHVVIYMFAAFPISCYQLFIMQGAFAVTDNLPFYRWNNMNNDKYSNQPWFTLTMLITDIFIYFVLFLVFNAFLPRQYGSPPFNIKNCFKLAGKINQKRRRNEFNETHGSDNDEIEYQETVIEVENLSKKYKGMKDSKALDDVSFTVKKGEVILVIGPNGAGKSTLINCLSGIIHSNEGEVSFYDDHQPPSIGVCFQDDILIKSLTVKEHFDLFGAYRGVSARTLQESMNYLGSILNLSKFEKQRSANLSGGQKRKLCIALALLGNPKIILMDEPTTSVDVPGRLLIWKMLSNLRDSTFIVVSHEIEEAEYAASRLLIMTDGEISFYGTSTQLKQQYKCGYELRLNVDNENYQPILKLAKEFIHDAEFSEDRSDVIRIPDSSRISDFLLALTEKKEEFGVKSYTFSVEQFEDVLMNLVYK